jgi:hypothetical protein
VRQELRLEGRRARLDKERASRLKERARWPEKGEERSISDLSPRRPPSLKKRIKVGKLHIQYCT